jgi:uncharacterized protein YyaL (SSP411 family)
MEQQTMPYSSGAAMSQNQLKNAASPYLLQHAENPVHWWEWKPEALEAARQTDKPILLSIGYAACHWCHVMAHESFEDESTAGQMNSLFINIKVDREERPDIDQIYMAALHALGQPGGWPLTMFLTPSGEPFWGGTYFPKDASYGRPSFQQVLTQVAETFRKHPDKIGNNVQALKNAVTQTISETHVGDISLSTLDDFARRLYPHMDAEHGGLQGAPKFPNGQILELFFRAAERTGDRSFLKPPLLALTQMIRGGIHDHVGGGFARYSVDERWHVPHFEKMLYDNAQILELLAKAYACTGDFEYRIAAESIVDWLQREMITSSGAFSASLDADSDGVEGKFYCWTKAEIIEVLGPANAEKFCSHYDVQPSGNWQEMHTGARTNVLNRLNDTDRTEIIEAWLKPLREKLLAARATRIPPMRDDKILADWNGLMIAALARASHAFGRKDWLTLAETCFHSVLESMSRREGDFLRLAHSTRANQYVWPGMATDYAYMTKAALTLNSFAAASPGHDRASVPKSYIKIASRLADALLHFHASPETGILSLPASDARDVIFRTFTTSDDAIPNPSAIAFHSLLILGGATGDQRYVDAAGKMKQSILPAAMKNPFGHASFWNALDFDLDGTLIVITGKESDQLVSAALNANSLNRFVIQLKNADWQNNKRFPTGGGERASAYICKGQTCSLPLTEAAEVKAALKADT